MDESIINRYLYASSDKGEVGIIRIVYSTMCGDTDSLVTALYRVNGIWYAASQLYLAAPFNYTEQINLLPIFTCIVLNGTMGKKLCNPIPYLVRITGYLIDVFPGDRSIVPNYLVRSRNGNWYSVASTADFSVVKEEV